MTIERVPIVLTVDYGQTWQQMVEAGKYTEASEVGFSEKMFPLVRTEKKRGVIRFDAELICMNRPVGDAESARLVQQLGLALPGIEHLLAVGAQYPDECLPKMDGGVLVERPIVATGLTPAPRGSRQNTAYLAGWYPRSSGKTLSGATRAAWRWLAVSTFPDRSFIPTARFLALKP